MQDGGLEKPKPRPEGTLLFPWVCDKMVRPSSCISVWGTGLGSCVIAEGRVSFVKPSLSFAREGVTGLSCPVLEIRYELQITWPWEDKT